MELQTKRCIRLVLKSSRLGLVCVNLKKCLTELLTLTVLFLRDFFLSDNGQGGGNCVTLTHFYFFIVLRSMRAIIGPPGKRHFNAGCITL